ncbi:NADH-quinone oxidoreductase subunit N [Fulvimonas yonginensis]|uniref:NADH-quinone oxidoreductase subunit N n=1 Tax=Fulvimonas yonginensis TaxID=1495200 RepID=A0ABU8J8Q6_9GAMM
MPLGDVLPEIAVLVTAVIGLLLASFAPMRRQWLGAPLALIGLALAGVLCAMQWSGQPRLTFSGTWALDGASIAARLIILAATAIAVLLAPEWFRHERRHGEYYSMLLLSALGAMAMAGAADTLQLVMGVLLSSVTGYTLAAWHRDWALSVEAGMKYFLIGAFANTLLMLGVALLFGLLGRTGYQDMAVALTHAAASPLLLLALALVVIGVAFELGAVPVHTWLPDVAEGAPAPAAAFLTVVPKIGAALALARLLHVFPTDAIGWRPLLAAIAVATMTLGNLAALWQTDLRRLLGWSSVSQAGYALMAVTVIGASGQAMPALLFFLAGYAAANLTAFAVVVQLRGRTELADYSGLAHHRPLLAAGLTLSLLSLVGIPPLAGFVGKLTLFLATIDAGYAWLAVVAILNTVVSLFYYLRAIAPIYFHERKAAPQLLGNWAGSGVIAGVVAVLVLGLLAQALLGHWEPMALPW